MKKVVPFERDSAYLANRARVNRRAGRMLDALALQRRAAEQEKDGVRRRMELARLLYQMDCCGESNRVLWDLTENPEAPRSLWYAMCLNYMDMGETHMASRALMRYLAESPESTQSESVLGTIQMLAEEQVRQDAALEGRRVSRAARLRKAARICQMRDDLSTAQTLLERAIRVMPDGETRAALCRVLSLRGCHEQAALQAEKLLDMKKIGASALAAAAWTFARAGQKRRAAALIARLEKEPLEQAERRMLLEACCAAEDHERVFRIVGKALSDAPYDRRLLHCCAVNCLRRGQDEKKAEAFWQKALRVDPEDVVARYALRMPEKRKDLSYDYALPPETCARLRTALSEMLWLKDSMLSEKNVRARAMEACRWGVFCGDRQAMLMARRLLLKMDDPSAKRLFHESMAAAYAQEGDPQRTLLTEDMPVRRIPFRLRRAVIHTVFALGDADPKMPGRIGQIAADSLAAGRPRLPGTIHGISAALYCLSGDKTDDKTISGAADLFSTRPRRVKRCMRILMGIKEKNSHEVD